MFNQLILNYSHMIRIAHLSDCHIGPLPQINPVQLVNKRISGYLNWRRHRRHVHKNETLDALCADLSKQCADHIAITGDLVNLALPYEFLRAHDWLETVGDPGRVSLVPGNHDAYVRLNKDPGMYRWHPYMKSDENGVRFAGESPDLFPYVRFITKNIVVIGLSSAVPTPVFMATGKLGTDQLIRFQEIVSRLRQGNYFCVVMIHHPPMPDMTKPKRSLLDAEPLTKILRQLNAGLVLHGHNHVNSKILLETMTGQIPVIGVPSASCSKQGKEPLARYNLFDISRSGNCWKCTMTGRGFEAVGGKIAELENISIY